MTLLRTRSKRRRVKLAQVLCTEDAHGPRVWREFDGSL